MHKVVSALLRASLVVVVSTCLARCGPPASGEADAAGVVSYTARGSAKFAGTWNMKFKGVRDGCGLGLKGKSFPGTVIITQKGTKVGLSIVGLAKKFKGSVNGSLLNTTGTYVVSGFTLSGSVVAKLSGANKLKITSASLKIRTKAKSCTVVLSGSGTK